MEDAFRFIDIHSHILPEIDDGARDFEESLTIMDEMREAGGKGIVLTPHVVTDGSVTRTLDSIGHKFDLLKRLSVERGIAIDLYLGAELMLHPELPQRVREDKRLTVNGKGKYVLIEMPFFEIPFYAPSIFFSLLACGITPIWAHPERCNDVINDQRILSGYTNNGVLLQINAGSLLGKYGKKVGHTAAALVKNEVPHILASDTHSPGHIKTTLVEAFRYVEKMTGSAKAVDMTFSSPLKVLS